MCLQRNVWHTHIFYGGKAVNLSDLVADQMRQLTLRLLNCIMYCHVTTPCSDALLCQVVVIDNVGSSNREIHSTIHRCE